MAPKAESTSKPRRKRKRKYTRRAPVARRTSARASATSKVDISFNLPDGVGVQYVATTSRG